MDVNIYFNLFLIAFLLFSNGFFVASEFAMVKVRKTRIEQLVNEGDFNAKIAMEALKDLDKFIAAVQLGVTISSIGLGWVGESTLARIIDRYLHSCQIQVRQLQLIRFRHQLRLH